MMDSDATTMTQDTENLVDSPKAVLLRGSVMRKWIGITQAIIALILFGLGVTFILVRPPISPNEYSYENEDVISLRIIHNCAVGIWGGVVFFITGTVGIFSGKTKNMVSLYLALCLASLLLAVIGLGSSGAAIGFNVSSKQRAFENCRYQQRDVHDYSRITCCISHYDCPRHDGRDWSSVAAECEEIKEQYEICTSKVIRNANSRMPLYAVTVAVFTLECFFTILGASFTCIGLCDCSKKQDTQEENLDNVHHSSHYQTERSTRMSDHIPSSNNFTNEFQAPRFILLNAAAQPAQLKNNSLDDSTQSQLAQTQQMVIAPGQVVSGGQVMLVNASGHVTPHLPNEIGGPQEPPPPSYTVSS